MSIRSKKIKLKGGLVQSVEDDEPNHDKPNLLYLYYAYKHNIYYLRVRKAGLYFATTKEKQEWESMLRTAVSGMFWIQILYFFDCLEVKARPRKLLVFINPFGGKRLAKSIYEKQVEPIFKLAESSCEVVLTQRYTASSYDFMYCPCGETQNIK